jgi:mitosis inhibitor protein kinase SWE1
MPSTPFLTPGSHLGQHAPGTPTSRDSEVKPAQLALTPSNTVLGHDVDTVLQARFNKSEWYARGVFSEVYKVTELVDRTISHGYFSATAGSKSSQTSSPERLYIVKKSRHQFLSQKVMQRKLREVKAMQKIGNSEHVVRLINHWEANYHLYIQLEFCEEGSLDEFLAKTGLHGRLDDFRIWKILIELTDVS